MTLERELKLDVAGDFVVPALDDPAHGIRAPSAGVHLLDATYWDTADLALLQAGIGLRRRTTDGEAPTWTIKGESTLENDALVRDEVDINSGSLTPPPDVVERLPSRANAQGLLPVARITTQRTIVNLVDLAGSLWAEVADDRVTVHDADGRGVASFREIEVELKGPPDAERMQEIVRRLRAAGATSSRFGAKYVRALAALGRDVR